MRSFRPAKLALVILLVVIAAAVWFYGWAGTSPGNITHVILISVDTCRADYLGCYGYERETTPNIDALAREGVLFENVLAPVPLTFPSHSSMLTGTTPLYHQVHDNFRSKLAPSYVTLAEVLKEAGFATGAVLSSFVLGSHTGLNQGFDYYDEYEMEWRKDESHNGRRAEDTTRLAGMWLEKHKSDRSFLFLHYYDPHLPYDPPQPFAGRFRSNPYAGEIAYTDKYIGRVIEKLKDLGLYDSSLIILTADHGEMLGEHGEHEHGYFIYEAAVKVPLIVKMPDGPRGKSVNDLAGIVDIFPSICAALGIPVPAHVQGKDLTGYLTARGGSAEDRYYYSESLWPTEYGGNSLLGVVTRRWKYIQTTKPELYDLEKNPEETDNLIGKQPKRAHLLREHLKLILEEQSYKGNSAGGGALDPETIKRLESLGYIASAGAGQSPHFDASRPDPKDLLPQHLLALKINLLETRKQHEEARATCRDAIEKYPENPYFCERLGKMAFNEGNMAEAVRQFSKFLAIVTDIQKRRTGKAELTTLYLAHHKLTKALFQLNRFAEAAKHLKKALPIGADLQQLHGDLGYALSRLKRFDEAVEHLTEALRIRPDMSGTLNNLAWLKATYKNEKFHDPKEAVRLARRACEITEYKKPNLLDTLAVAYAAAGRFPDAVSTAEAALALARDAGNDKLVDEIQGHLNLFKRSQPYYETE